jgi:hypothetical protein
VESVTKNYLKTGGTILMNLGRIKKVYTLNQTLDKRILDQIQESLEGKHVDSLL